MANLFNTDAQASSATFSGQSADAAMGLPSSGGYMPPPVVGMPVRHNYPGSMAPYATSRMEQAAAGVMQGIDQEFANEEPVQAPQRTEARVGYRPETNEVYSGGKVFNLDLDQSTANAQLFDVDNEQLPAGFHPVHSGQLKQVLQKEYDSLGMMDGLQRRAGQAVSNFGSTFEDLGAESIGRGMQDSGGALARRNPAKVGSVSEAMASPGQFLSETAGELSYDVATMTGASIAGAAAGAALAPFTGGLSIPIGAILGGIGARGLLAFTETYGSIRSDQREAGTNNVGKAVGGAALSAGLEAVVAPEAFLAKFVGRGATQATKQLTTKALQEATQAAGRGMLRKAGRTALIQGSGESGTEFLQEGAERWGAGSPVFDDKGIAESSFAALKGAAGGGSIGMVMGSGEYRQAKQFVDDFKKVQEIAADPDIPSAQRLAAAKYVQEVLSGDPSDAALVESLAAFKQNLASVDAAIKAAEIASAVAEGAPADLTNLPGKPIELQPAGEAALGGALAQQESAGGYPTIQEGPPAPGGVAPLSMEMRGQLAGPMGMTGGLPTTAPLTPAQDYAATNPDGPAAYTGGVPQAAPMSPMQAIFAQGPVAAQGVMPQVQPAQGLSQGMMDQLTGPTRGDRLGVEVAPEVQPDPDTESAAPAPAPTGPAPDTLFKPVPEGRGMPKVPVAEAPALSEKETAELRKLLDEASEADLDAAVEGNPTVAVPGRASLTPGQLGTISDALMNPEGVQHEDAGAQEIVDSLRAFARAFHQLVNYSGNAARNLRFKPDVDEKTRISQTKGKATLRATALGAKMGAAREALGRLGRAAGNNPKNVEALVRLAKNIAQQRVGDGKVSAPVKVASTKLDTMLSQAWNAAKNDVYRGDVDVFHTRQGVIRDANERKALDPDAPTPLERTAAGYKPFGKGETTYTGLDAVLRYLEAHGQPSEKWLGKAVREALYAQGNTPTLKFITSGKSRYNPKTNTVFIHREESPAVVLHEALHAALQWFVYNNPTAPEVKSLIEAVNKVVAYKGSLPAKAKAVQDVLKKLKGQGSDLDAALELVSYGNTLNDFRRALEAMPGKGVPKSFYDVVNGAYTAVKALVGKVLGVKQSLATEVLTNTYSLLEKASADTAPKTRKGRVLEAAVTADTPTPITAQQPTNAPVQPAITMSNDAAAQHGGYADARAFAETPGSMLNVTRWGMEAVGFGKDGKLTKAGQKYATKATEYMLENVPALERLVHVMAPKFRNAPLVNTAMAVFKRNAHSPVLQMERIAQTLAGRPALRAAFFKYMDGDNKALDGVPDGVQVQLMAELVRGEFGKHIAALPQNSPEARAFRGLKFSQYLLNPASVSQTATNTFGANHLAKTLGLKTAAFTSIDDFKEFLHKGKDGVVDTDRPLYAMYAHNPVTNGRTHIGYVDAAKYDKDGASPTGYAVDANEGLWRVKRYEKGAYVFVRSQAMVQDVAALKDNELTTALLNTTAALSHNYASRTFLQTLADGDQSFDNVTELSTATGRTITEAQILDGGAKEAESGTVRHQMRRSGTYVRLPKSAGDGQTSWGALAGKIIPGPMWNSIIDMHDRKPLTSVRTVNGVMRFFKKSKTIYNPGTHATNILSNVSLATMLGVDMMTVGKAAKLLLKFEASPGRLSAAERKLVQAFYSSGAVLGQYTATEVKQQLYEKLAANIDPDSDRSMLTRMKSFALYEKSAARLKKLDTAFTEAYAAEDNVFRFAAFLQVSGDIQLRDGTTTLSEDQSVEAGTEARRMFLDYDIDSPAVRVARQSFLPFVSWSYAVMPVLGRIAVERPWAMVNTLAVYAIMQGIMEGDDDDDRRKAPEYLRERAFGGLGPYTFVRVPFMGDDKNPVYFNMGKYLPILSLFQPAAGAQEMPYVPGFLTPNGPLASLMAMIYGYDPFSGKPLSGPTETTVGRVVNASEYMYNSMVPTLAGTKFYGKVTADLRGDKNSMGREPDSLYLARTIGGMGLYQFNERESEIYQNQKVKSIRSDYKAAMRKATKENMMRGYPDREALDKTLADLRKRMEDAVEGARNTSNKGDI